MQGYDILMLGVMALAIFRGYSKGLAWQISSIASIVISYYVAYQFKDRLAPMVEMPEPWPGLVAMMGLFVASSLVIWLISQSVRGAIEKAKLKDFDQQLGAIFGGVKGAVWCTAITLAALTFLGHGMSEQIVNSRSGGYIARLLASSKRIVPGEIQSVVQPYIRHAEEKLQDRVEPNVPPPRQAGGPLAGLPGFGSQPQNTQQPQPQQQPFPQPQEPEVYWRTEGTPAKDPLTDFSNNGESWR